MSAFQSKNSCGCTLCATNPDHPAKRFHDCFQHISGCMPAGDLSACLVQYGQRSEMGDTGDDILCQIGRLRTDQLALARNAVEQDQNNMTRCLRNAGDAIPALAANEDTRDWLTAVADAVVGQPNAFQLRARQIAVTLNGRTYRIEMPPDWMAYANFFEVFLRQNYEHDVRQVKTIFDIGAFVGLSALYLNSCYPNAEIIAVEPNPANLHALNRTLGLNGTEIRHRSIGKILAAESGTATIASLATAPESTNMMNSTVITLTDAPTEDVGAIGLSDLVGQTDSFGIKLDIEGGEFSLEPVQSVLSDAEWVLGEFHFGPWSKPSDRWLPDLLARDFELNLQLPRLEMTGMGEYFCIAQDFQAVKPLKSGAFRITAISPEDRR